MSLRAMKYLFSSIVLLAGFLGALPAYAESFRIAELKLSLNSQWGRPVLSRYDEATQGGDWRFIRSDATLIVTKAPCVECKELTQADVDAFNKQKSRAAGAILLNHKGLPAMLHLLPGENGENLRVFQLQVEGFRYEIRLGVDVSAPQAFGFQMEMEFLQMINGFAPEPGKTVPAAEPKRTGK